MEGQAGARDPSHETARCPGRRQCVLNDSGIPGSPPGQEGVYSRVSSEWNQLALVIGSGWVLKLKENPKKTNWLLTLGRYTDTVRKPVWRERLCLFLVILQISKAIGRAI